MLGRVGGEDVLDDGGGEAELVKDRSEEVGEGVGGGARRSGGGRRGREGESEGCDGEAHGEWARRGRVGRGCEEKEREEGRKKQEK